MKLKEIGDILLAHAVSGDLSVYFYNKQKKLHRADGPAVISESGYAGWYVKGHYVRSANLR